MRSHIRRKNKNKVLIFLLIILLSLLSLFIGKKFLLNKDKNNEAKNSSKKNDEISIMASGDMLYHDLVYWSAKTETGYDFSDNYKQITPLISKADLAIGDFEGTISKDFDLSGYPLFNAPPEVVSSIKATGYDVISLANNHILDSHLKGALETKKLFEDNGISTIGIKSNKKEKILVKNVKGIKVAIVGFSYGYNGMEALLSEDEYDTHMMDLDPQKVEATLKEAEKLADITVVMPQMGIEYSLEPTKEQREMYHKMVEWGADIIFGGHPHVPEPTETIDHNGKKKFILYSMGNLLSNQRLETLDNLWTERGVIMELRLKRNSNKKGDVKITKAIAHPTWVSRTAIPNTYRGYPLYKYETLLCEDYIEGGKYYNTLDMVTQKRVDSAYHQTLKLLNIDEFLSK